MLTIRDLSLVYAGKLPNGKSQKVRALVELDAHDLDELLAFCALPTELSASVQHVRDTLTAEEEARRDVDPPATPHAARTDLSHEDVGARRARRILALDRDD